VPLFEPLIDHWPEITSDGDDVKLPAESMANPWPGIRVTVSMSSE
jgi:hypothetical protein